jgi:hypothetical protein
MTTIGKCQLFHRNQLSTRTNTNACVFALRWQQREKKPSVCYLGTQRDDFGVACRQFELALGRRHASVAGRVQSLHQRDDRSVDRQQRRRRRCLLFASRDTLHNRAKRHAELHAPFGESKRDKKPPKHNVASYLRIEPLICVDFRRRTQPNDRVFAAAERVANRQIKA